MYCKIEKIPIEPVEKYRYRISAETIHPSFMTELIPVDSPAFLNEHGQAISVVTKSSLEPDLHDPNMEMEVAGIITRRAKEFGWKYLFMAEISSSGIPHPTDMFRMQYQLMVRGR